MNMLNITNDVALIIPSLDPDDKLINLLNTLDKTVTTIIINDGSSSKYDEYYEIAQNKYGAIILKNDINMGKGKALKTAFSYILEKLPDIKVVATLDSDGQHTFNDTIKCVNKWELNQEAIIFGSRSFEENADVPFKSKFGNLLTSRILQLLTGSDIKDTQTGLRVIPRYLLNDLLLVEGDGFEYEMNMIIYAIENKIEILEQPISTIYILDNQSTHFDPIKDSLKIYSVLFQKWLTFGKYLSSSILSFLLDILVFTVILLWMPGKSYEIITFATVIARILSSIFNFVLNRFFVFQAGTKKSIFGYFSLVLIQMFISATLVYLVSNIIISGNTSVIKICVDTILFIVSYVVQKKLIFR